MRDSYVRFTDGREVNVSDLTTPELGEAIDAFADPDWEIEVTGGVTRDDILERLRIELTIRELGL